MQNNTKYSGGQIMKKHLLFIAISGIMAFTSCTTTNQTRSAEDGVYYSTKDAQAPAPQTTQAPAGQYSQDSQQNTPQDYVEKNYTEPDYSTTEQSDGNTYITNNYYGYDDYYDYSYSSRIRRFYYPYYSSYYDPFYTNLYWYDYNPYSWGVSIYLGYNWWAPSWYYYNPFCYGYYSFYSPWYHHHYWNPWYSPYWSGYHHGYWDGYWHGYYGSNYYYDNPYYYNSYDNNSHYYGPRGTQSSNNYSASSSGNTYSQFKSIGQVYEQQVAMEKTSLPSMPAKGSGQVSTGNKASFTPTGKESQVTSPVNSPAKENNAVKQGNTGHAAINNNTPATKEGKAVEAGPSKGNAGNPNSSGRDLTDQYTTKPSESPVQNSMQESRQNTGGQRSGNVSRSENNSQQRSNTVQTTNSNSRTQEHQRREYSFPQREAEQPVQRQQENKQNRTAPDSRPQNREGYSRYAPSQEYSYPQRRNEQREQKENNAPERKRNYDSQPRNNEYSRPAPQRQERSYERKENYKSAPSQTPRMETPRMERREAPRQSTPQYNAPRQSAPQHSAPRNDSRSNSGGGKRR